MPVDNKEERRALLHKHIKVVQEELASLDEDGARHPILGARQREDEAAAMYESLTPKERLDLYEADRNEWQRLIDAYRSKNERKLLGLNR